LWFEASPGRKVSETLSQEQVSEVVHVYDPWDLGEEGRSGSEASLDKSRRPYLKKTKNKQKKKPQDQKTKALEGCGSRGKA
jgi:hypothetical protein